jgi:hypothetical protein
MEQYDGSIVWDTYECMNPMNSRKESLDLCLLQTVMVLPWQSKITALEIFTPSCYCNAHMNAQASHGGLQTWYTDLSHGGVKDALSAL